MTKSKELVGSESRGAKDWVIMIPVRKDSHRKGYVIENRLLLVQTLLALIPSSIMRRKPITDHPRTVR